MASLFFSFFNIKINHSDKQKIQSEEELEEVRKLKKKQKWFLSLLLSPAQYQFFIIFLAVAFFCSRIEQEFSFDKNVGAAACCCC